MNIDLSVPRKRLRDHLALAAVAVIGWSASVAGLVGLKDAADSWGSQPNKVIHSAAQLSPKEQHAYQTLLSARKVIVKRYPDTVPTASQAEQALETSPQFALPNTVGESGQSDTERVSINSTNYPLWIKTTSSTSTDLALNAPVDGYDGLSLDMFLRGKYRISRHTVMHNGARAAIIFGSFALGIWTVIIVGVLLAVLGNNIKARAARRSWRQLVRSSAYGPDEPTIGFSLLYPAREVSDDHRTLSFVADKYTWSKKNEREQWIFKGAVPVKGFEDCVFDEESDSVTVAERWVDFVRAVNQMNGFTRSESEETTAALAETHAPRLVELLEPAPTFATSTAT